MAVKPLCVLCIQLSYRTGFWEERLQFNTSYLATFCAMCVSWRQVLKQGLSGC